MKAIITKYLGATNTKGSRIKASDGGRNSVTIPYPHELDSEDAHRKAAEALRDKMGWKGKLIAGWVKNDCVFVFAPNAAISKAEGGTENA